jgi:hypothetical protein
MDTATLSEGLSTLQSIWEKRDTVDTIVEWLKGDPDMLTYLREQIPKEESIRSPRRRMNEIADSIETQFRNLGCITYKEAKRLGWIRKNDRSRDFTRLMSKINCAVKHEGAHRDGSRVFYYHEDKDPSDWAKAPDSGPIYVSTDGRSAAEAFLSRFAVGKSLHWKNIIKKETKSFITDKGSYANVNLMLADWNNRFLRPLMQSNGWIGQANMYKKINEEE